MANYRLISLALTSLDLTRAAAFAIRIVSIAVLVWAIRWW
ncbi:hypothetical protein [Escherichia coli]|nr:hypothetical protein [Escherichia coli]